MIIYRWTGIESKALREAMLLGVDKFAAKLNIAARTVANWEAKGAQARLRPTSRELLENALASATPEVVARFEQTLADIGSRRHEPGPAVPAPVTLANDTLDQFTPTVLGVDADQVWVPARTAAGEVVVVSLPRRTFVLGAGAGMLAAAAGVPPARSVADTVAALSNSRIDHVTHFRNLRMTLIEDDNLFGARRALPMMEDSLRAMRELRRAGIGDSKGLLQTQILYAEVAAWLHQDGRRFDCAQYWADRALRWSHELGDDYFIALALIRQAQLADDMGEGSEAVELARAAERAAPPGTRFPVAAAAYAGLGYAMSGDRGNSDRAFDHARAILDDAEFDPTWGMFLDEAYIDVHQALGRTSSGDHRAATDQYTAAIASMRSGYPRDRGVYLARKALAHHAAGEIEPAAAAALEAFQIGLATESARILYEVERLGRVIDRGSRQPGVAELCDALESWRKDTA
ncbi:helix-turn-helix domain-containing protein [Nocardia pneumoniae]|uniref:helix-turn-helix domain-containing protein n=1 Tax=Nocardia pneumoniae TaxID=228601 RepID=UPI0002E67039|nr:hypothetical protein [Nocardia pneumoniae]